MDVYSWPNGDKASGTGAGGGVQTYRAPEKAPPIIKVKGKLYKRTSAATPPEDLVGDLWRIQNLSNLTISLPVFGISLGPCEVGMYPALRADIQADPGLMRLVQAARIRLTKEEGTKVDVPDNVGAPLKNLKGTYTVADGFWDGDL